MQTFVSEVAANISAGYALIGIESFEEERVEHSLNRLAQSVKRPLKTWAASQGFGEGRITHPLEALKSLATEPNPCLILLKDFHPYLGDPQVVRTLRDFTSGAQKHIIMLLSPTLALPMELEKDVARVHVPLPTEDELRSILDERVAAAEKSGKAQAPPDDLLRTMTRAARGLTGKDARRVFKRALGNGRDPVAVVLHDKQRMLRETDLLEYSEPGHISSQLGGLSELKRWLGVRQRALTPEAQEFGLPQPRGVFLLGVQGCGKSLTAKAVADMWQLPLLRLDVSGLVAARTTPSDVLRRATSVAETMAPCILWIDEIEKGFHGARENSATMRALGAFVTWMQERTEPVFVVATANEIEGLPPELLRRGRFDEIFFVDLPDVHDREEILAIHLAKRGRAGSDYELDRLAEMTEKFSGAELEQVVVSALYAAFEEAEELNAEHLRRAAQDTVPLAISMQESIETLRRWARDRARPAARETRRIDYFDAREN